MKRTLLIAALALGACNRGPQQEPPALPPPPAIHVETETVQARPMPRDLPLTGQLVTNQQSAVAANAAGRVVKTFVDRGSYVKKGEVLVQLDTSSAQLAEAEARANLQTATASQELAATLCKRNQELFDKGAISKEEWERTNTQCETAQSQTLAAKARVDLASKSLSDATVRAPFDGMVGQRYVSLGEYVMPSTKVADMVELDPLRLQLTVSEADVGRVTQGAQVQFEVEAFPGESFTGTVKYIDPTVRSATRDLVVEAVVQNPDHKLKPGMFATAHLRLADEPLPAVPRAALVSEGSSAHVFAVVDSQVEERIVQVGPERDGYVAILDGLRAGEKVVAKPDDKVKDGVPVN